MARNKVFLDSSVLIAAVLSQSGGSFYILNKFRNNFEFQINDYIFDEILEVINNKFDSSETFKNKFFLLLGFTPIKIILNPTKNELKTVNKIINDKDAPILVSALKYSNYLLTLDNDFLTNPIKELAHKKKVVILKPEGFISLFKNKLK